MGTYQNTFLKFDGVKFPAYVKLSDGQEKLFYGSLKDGYSWACQQKQEIVDVVSEKREPAPKNYNPSNAAVIESHVFYGGSRNDFTASFLSSK